MYTALPFFDKMLGHRRAREVLRVHVLTGWAPSAGIAHEVALYHTTLYHVIHPQG